MGSSTGRVVHIQMINVERAFVTYNILFLSLNESSLLKRHDSESTGVQYPAISVSNMR